MAGVGIFGDNVPLRPRQRFWNLKQVAATPPRSFSIPEKCDKPGMACAASGNIAESLYTVHIVSYGGSGRAVVRADAEEMRSWVTDSMPGMEGEAGSRSTTAGPNSPSDP